MCTSVTMKRLKDILVRLKNSRLNNKYIIVFVLFVVFIAFFDDSSLYKRWKVKRQTAKIERETEYYRERMAQDSARIEALGNNVENLERFAREKYYMKKADEDVFIIREK